MQGKPCASCPPGQSSSDGISCDTCTDGALVAYEATGVLQCLAPCPTGYAGATCTDCASGYAHPLASAGAPTTCVLITSVADTSVASGTLICNANFYDTAGTCAACSSFGTSPAGASACTCSTGYSGSSCVDCDVGYSHPLASAGTPTLCVLDSSVPNAAPSLNDVLSCPIGLKDLTTRCGEFTVTSFFG